MPRNLMVTINNSNSVTLTWEPPAMLNGIIRNYAIIILDGNMNNTVQSQTLTDLSDLTYVITQLTHDTSYVVNVSGVTVRTGDAASETFTTPACKNYYIIVIIDIKYFLLNQCLQFH